MFWKMKVTVFVLTLLCFAALAGCSSLGQDRNAPLPTVVLDTVANTSVTPVPANQQSGGEVVASGNVVAANEVNASAATGGRVLKLLVKEGDRVSAGQVLLQLSGSERLTASVKNAQYEQLSAQQARQALDDGLSEAQAAAQLRLSQANQGLDKAQKQRNWRQYRNGSDAMINSGEADVIVAKDRLKDAQDAYNSVANLDDSSVLRAGALSALATAQRAYDKALSNLDYLTAMPNALELERVEAELKAAQTEVQSAKKEVEKLKNGPDPETVALADARVTNAAAQVAAAQAAMADLEVKASVNGTVAVVMIQPGEWAQIGQPILKVIDLEHLQVETSDLSERDVAQINVGQSVTVTIKALGEEVKGKVIRISPLADKLGGDVIYKTIIEMDSTPPGLLPGMTVDAHFESMK
jgi:multidrug efflux pump subunit AcrA (membrane-fusion protein)